METIKRMIDDAYGHLHTATIQMVPRDDQIICDHVRDALVSLEIARGELKGIQEVNGEMLAVLQAVLQAFPYLDWARSDLTDRIKAAIAKAKGSTQT